MLPLLEPRLGLELEWYRNQTPGDFRMLLVHGTALVYQYNDQNTLSAAIDAGTLSAGELRDYVPRLTNAQGREVLRISVVNPLFMYSHLRQADLSELGLRLLLRLLHQSAWSVDSKTAVCYAQSLKVQESQL